MRLPYPYGYPVRLSFLDILHSNVPCRILLCNDSKIIASKNYHTALNMPVTESIQRLLQQGKMKLIL